MKKEIPTEPLSDESEWSDSADPSEDEELSSHYGEDEEEDGDVHESGGESDSSEDYESSLDNGEDRGTNRDVTKSVGESDSSEDEPYVDWFVWEDKAHPLSNAPEPKRRFIRSKWEDKKMAPQNKPAPRIIRKHADIIDVASTDTQSIEIHGHDTSKSRIRSGNWTDITDSAMLNLMTKEHVLGNFINESFTTLAWSRIVHDFNERTKLSYLKSHLQNRLKVLKRQFVMYQTLANKSGWGLDYDRNIPTAGDSSAWDTVISENPAYARCKDKPFPAYHDIEFLSGKTTATGRHGFITGMPCEDIRSTSSSSPGTMVLYEQIQKTLLDACGPGQTSSAQPLPMPQSPRNDDVHDTTSCSPTPTPGKSPIPIVSSASGHTSSGKRRRSSPPSRKTTPTSSRKGRVGGTPDSINELVELGKKRLHIAECML